MNSNSAVGFSGPASGCASRREPRFGRSYSSPLFRWAGCGLRSWGPGDRGSRIRGTASRARTISRGFGFVEMPNKEEAEKAISGLNGVDLKGRPLTANEARPRTDRPRTGGGGFGGGRY